MILLDKTASFWRFRFSLKIADIWCISGDGFTAYPIFQLMYVDSGSAKGIDICALSIKIGVAAIIKRKP